MTTAKIDRVAYIGWRGIKGCEVINLNDELTGFIGAGGAGKSTLVICLDYALLPDRRALDIRSVSDLHDSRTAGMDSLLGRIDQNYGYAYVVLDITTRHGQRLISGIYVEPVDGRAMFTCWLIKDPPKDIPVQELMRGLDGEEIYFPDFPALKRELATNGIDVTTCKGVGDYGQALYDAGILPSSMNSTTDRTLYGNLIETTFRGGISQEVAVRLKDYLLPAQTQVQELMRGLQACTNEVLKTRNAVADADKELALLESTYGIGREAVLTAVRCITDDMGHTSTVIKSLKADLADKVATSQSLAAVIPQLEREIAVTEETKRNTLALSVQRVKALELAKEEASRLLSQRQTELEAATGRLKRFCTGGELWKEIASQHIQDGEFEDAEKWLDGKLEKINREIYAIDNDIAKLKAEDERLSSDRASVASEHLAEVLGGQSLEQALGHVSDKEAIELEMCLGGLVDGVVGVGFDALSDLSPTDDMPELFWLGERLPTPQAAREMDNWYAAAVSGGHVVARKDKVPAFGREARQLCRATITTELEKLKRGRTVKRQDADKIEESKKTLQRNHEVICFYLDNRSNSLSINKAAKDAQGAFDQCQASYDAAKNEHSTLQDQILRVQEPYDTQIHQLQTQFSLKEKALSALQKETADMQHRLGEDEARLADYSQEYGMAQTLLGSEFDRFCTDCIALVSPSKNITGQQARRIVQLARTLGADAEQLDSFRNVDAEDRVSVIRLWPDLMAIVRETVNVELADSDGGDLIQAMREQRSRLDTDLATWEAELGIKAKNIYMSISGNVRSQQQKIGKLSRLGQVIEFGNVTGIQIKLVPRTRMIDILQQFADQLMLFSNGKPVDQVLKEFFDASITGGVKLSGEQLLDYRNYVDLVIEARRKGGDWDLASSLSGTETIGCGLAISLMLIRSIAARGESIGSGVKVSDVRPLFAIDEVGRLNSDGQRMLVEFAKREKFQLVVTAPTMKPTYDCTLYALYRHFEPHDQLIIRGIKHRESPAFQQV